MTSIESGGSERWSLSLHPRPVAGERAHWGAFLTDVRPGKLQVHFKSTFEAISQCSFIENAQRYFINIEHQNPKNLLCTKKVVSDWRHYLQIGQNFIDNILQGNILYSYIEGQYFVLLYWRAAFCTFILHLLYCRAANQQSGQRGSQHLLGRPPQCPGGL